MSHRPSDLQAHIQWHEGMLLGPQHFQQESARVDALVAWQSLAGQPHAWGVRLLDIDEGLLATGLLRILAFEGVLPDGTAVQYNAALQPAAPLQLDLQPWAEAMQQQDVAVYLTLGRSRSTKEAGQTPRFQGVRTEPVEDEISDALPVDIPRMRPQLGLSAGDVPSSVWVSMKLATVRKDNEVVRLGAFQPASLDLGASHPYRLRGQALATQLRSKAAFLAKLHAVASSRVEDRLQALETRQRLACLTQPLPVLEALVRSAHLHPYSLYLGLCAVLGSLSLLRPGAVPAMPQPWDQADPRAAIEPLFEALEEAVAEVSQDWRTQVFRFEADHFELALQPEWIGRRLVVGLRGSTERELLNWMSVAVIGSAGVWASLSDRRVLGAPRKPIDDAPELGLKGGTGYLLFAIDPMPDVVQPAQTLVISNPNEAPGSQRPQEVVLFVKG